MALFSGTLLDCRVQSIDANSHTLGFSHLILDSRSVYQRHCKRQETSPISLGLLLDLLCDVDHGGCDSRETLQITVYLTAWLFSFDAPYLEGKREFYEHFEKAM